MKTALTHCLLQVFCWLVILKFSAARGSTGRGVKPPQCTLEFIRPELDDGICQGGTTHNLRISPNDTYKCKEMSKFIECNGNEFRFPRVETCDQIRINCSDTQPLELKNDIPLRFAGMVVDFERVQIKKGFLHRISVTLPKTVVPNEGLEKYSGIYEFQGRNKTWNFPITLNITGTTSNSESNIATPEPLCVDIQNNFAVCEVEYSDNQIYFANIETKNPFEASYLRPCLASNQKHGCANKNLGQNCQQRRYCMKLMLFQNGLLGCEANNQSVSVEYFRDIYTDIHFNLSKMWESDRIISIEEHNSSTTFDIHVPEVTDHEEHNSISTEEFRYGNNCLAPPFGPSILQPAQQTLENGQNHTFECHFLNYFLVPPVFWTINYKNGAPTVTKDLGENLRDKTRTVIDGSLQSSVQVKSSRFEFRVKKDIVSITCEVMYYNSTIRAKSVRQISVKG